MSADLFAEFSDFSQPTSTQQQSQPKPSTQPPPYTSDPFSFITSTPASTAANSIPTQQNQQWASSLSQTNQQGNQWQNNQWASGTSGWAGATSTLTSPPKDDEDDDDGWGDFETAPTTSNQNAASTQTTTAQNPSLKRIQIMRAPTIDLMTNLADLTASSNSPYEASGPSRAPDYFQQAQKPPPTGHSHKAPQKASNNDSNVLFDADDFEEGQDGGIDDDDFGEFETVASPAQPPPDLMSYGHFAPPTQPMPREGKASDLLSGLTLDAPASPYPQAPRSPSFHARNPFPGLALATPPETQKQIADKPKSTPATAWPSMDQFGSAGSNEPGDDWGDFDDLPEEPEDSSAKPTDSSWDWDAVEPEQPAKPVAAAAQVPASTSDVDSTWDWDPVDTKNEAPADSDKNSLPPINIPPPSILLSVFPQLFEQTNSTLYKPVSGQPFSIKNRILSDPKTLEFLKGYLILATVAARIIAGRKMRWHRDKFLSQSMSISAAGSKGMKLAGIDKAQTVREDREAADVVSNWKEHVGRLRSAIAAANASMKDVTQQLKIPEINETMPVQTAKMVPTAPKACIICGLKRNERVPKVDYEVEDSFGEWWVDHWGHLACKRFWLQHENALRQR